MPFLKFSRDKRGYENFQLIEPPSSGRRGGKSRPRLLFWFRTPPQMKVGRMPFSDDVRRMVEAQNPGMTFDWARIMSTPIPPPDADHWRERRRMEKAAKRAAREPDEDVETPAVEPPPEIVAAGEAVTEAVREEAIAVAAAPEVDSASGDAGDASDSGEADDADGGADDSATPTETAVATSDAQGAAVPGQRRRRRRRRGRRGRQGQPGQVEMAGQNQPQAPATAETVSPQAEPAIEPERPPANEV